MGLKLIFVLVTPATPGFAYPAASSCGRSVPGRSGARAGDVAKLTRQSWADAIDVEGCESLRSSSANPFEPVAEL